jgi:hypothetical protein
MRRLVFVLALASLLAVPALALPINGPVPSDAYIVYNNLDWAWGGACPYSGGCYATGDLTYQGTQGGACQQRHNWMLSQPISPATSSPVAEMFLMAELTR